MINAVGDIATVDSTSRHLSQQAYLRLMTERGDFVLYPNLGASLQNLIGMPNTPDTAEYGKQLISAALDRETVFAGVNINVDAVPVSEHAIRFDVYVNISSRLEKILSIVQDLAILTLDNEQQIVDSTELPIASHFS